MKEDLFDKILAKYGVAKNQKKAILDMLYYEAPDGTFHDFYYNEDEEEDDELEEYEYSYDDEFEDSNCMVCEDGEEYKYESSEKTKSIKNIYDKTMRKALDEKKNAVRIINIALNAKATVTEDEIEKYTSSYVTQNLENSEADIVYKLKGNNVFFLLEHQSKVDNSMAYRVARYQFEIIDSVIKDTNGKYKNKGYKFPLVIPIVIYIGKGKWTAKQKFEEMQISWGKDIVKGFSNYLFVDVNQMKESELLGDSTTITKVMLMQKAKTEEEFNTYWEDVENDLEEKIEEYTEDQMEFVRNVIVSIAMTRYQRKDIEVLLKKYKKQGGKDNMIAVVECLRKDREKAVKESRIKGIEEGKNKMMGVVENLKKDREKAVRESRIKGIEEGKNKMMGVVENLKKDREKAVRESRIKGKREAKLEVAKKMISYNIDIEVISRTTGIPLEELKEIKPI